MLQALDAAALRRWCVAGLAALTAARIEIDELNVYPVPDGDTGINLQRTMESVVEALTGAAQDQESTAQAMAYGALMGARGNSGVILSQLLRGLAEVWGEGHAAGPEDVQRALIRGTELAYAAVAAPAEGTILSVVREAAAAAAEVGPVSLAAVVGAACSGAASALARTTEQLPQLAAAGVVDAGGRGLCVLLDALLSVIIDQPIGAVPVPVPVPRRPVALVASPEFVSPEFAYEVQYLLRDAGEDDVATLFRTLAELGDSLAVVGTDGIYNVHVHVNDVGAALEAGVQAGRPFRITVTRFADQ